MTDDQLFELGRTHYIVGVRADGTTTRASENMTPEQAKKWSPGLLSGFFKSSEVRTDFAPKETTGKLF